MFLIVVTMAVSNMVEKFTRRTVMTILTLTMAGTVYLAAHTAGCIGRSTSFLTIYVIVYYASQYDKPRLKLFVSSVS